MRKELQIESPGIVRQADVQSLDSHRPIDVQVVDGVAYVTREGDAHDYILRSGDHLRIEERGTVIIQGLPCAEFKVSA